MENLAVLLLTTAGASMFAYVTLFLSHEYRIERFRQSVFEIRDELFDFAVEGNIEFGDPAYGALRGSMNSMIRFAHKMSLSYAVGIWLAQWLRPSPAVERLAVERMRPLLELPQSPVREKLLALHTQALLEIFRLVASSPILAPVILFARLLAPLAGTAGSLYRRLLKKREQIAETIEVQAMECDLEMNTDQFGELQAV